MRVFPFRAAALAVLMLFVLTGCDVVGDDEPLVIREEVDFRFEFSTDGQVGETMSVQSNGVINLDDVLFDEGYTRDDVAIANLQSVTVERVQPVGTDLDVFESIELSLIAQGVNVPTHAESDDLPSDDSAELTVTAPGVSEVVWEEEFRARLTVVPTIEEEFVVRAVVAMRIDIESGL